MIYESGNLDDKSLGRIYFSLMDWLIEKYQYCIENNQNVIDAKLIYSIAWYTVVV